MRQPAPTNGSGAFAASRKSNAGSAPIRPSSPSSDEMIEKHCGAAMARDRTISSPASIRCCRMKPAGFWPPISTRKAGRPTLRHGRNLPGERRSRRPRTLPVRQRRPCLDLLSEPVPARTARQLGAAIMTETMERRPEIGFASYDRFFPSQDTMPIGGFGNLIALPLQRGRANTETASSSMKTFDPTTINGRFCRRRRVCPPTPSRTSLPTRRRAAGFWACECRSRMRTPMSHGA